MFEIKDLGNGKYFLTITKKDFNNNDYSYGYTFEKSELKLLFMLLRDIFSTEN